MRASELIKKLEELVTEHGDLAVFSTADWEFVEEVSYEAGKNLSRDCVESERRYEVPHFVIE